MRPIGSYPLASLHLHSALVGFAPGHADILSVCVMRCDQCQFWAFGFDAGSQYGEQEDTRLDERLGSCRRHAPRPTIGQMEYLVARALWLLVPGEDQGLSQSFEEAYLEQCSWPTTMANDWCGEFVGKE